MKIIASKLPDYLLPCFAAASLLVACGGGDSSSSIISLTNGQAASVVVGKANFTGTLTGNAASTLYSPNGSVFVSKRNRGRIVFEREGHV